MNNEPFISVIVPVYNGEKTIGACIESLLAQEYPRDRCEIVIVDNKSTDNTPQIAKGYRVRYLLEDRIKGSYAARNAGIRNAKGSILAFTDADCIADKEWLKKGIAGFTDDTVGCIAGGIEGQKSDTYIQEYLESKNMLSQRESSRFFGFLPYAQTANAFYRRDVFDKIGFFEERWVSGGDADLSWRMQLETDNRIVFADDAVILHKHRSTTSALFEQVAKNGEGNVLLYKKYRHKLPPHTMRQDLWAFYRFCANSVTLARYAFHKVEKTAPDQRESYLNLLTAFARGWGRIKGSIKNGIVYL